MQSVISLKILEALGRALIGSCRDLAPIVGVIVLFQGVILRQAFPDVGSTLGGLGLLFLVQAQAVEPVLSAVREAGRFHEPGTGIAFVVPVEQTAGLESQLSGRQS